MALTAFLTPRLTGSRFDGHAIPIEFLRDFSVLQDMIVEAAKQEFLRQNSSRQRVPRGFDRGLQLKLTGIEEGSAMPVFGAVILAANLFGQITSHTYFEQARDAIVHAVRAAESHQPVGLSDKVLSYFNEFGRSLRDGEAIEFAVPGTREIARLTKETRRALVMSSQRVNVVSETVVLYGRVPEYDQPRKTCNLELIDTRRVSVSVDDEHHQYIMEAFVGYTNGIRVRIEGFGSVNRTGRVERVDTVESCAIVEARDVRARLDDFRSLKDGWLDGEGMSYDTRQLEWLSDAFEVNLGDESPLPYLYPVVTGEVRAEWQLNSREVSLQIDLRSHLAMFHSLELSTDEVIENTFDLNSAEGWTSLSKILKG